MLTSRRGALLALGAGLLLPCAAAARPRQPTISWSISLPRRPDRDQLEKVLRKSLEREARKAHWGKEFQDDVEAHIDVHELRSMVDGEMAHVSCAAIGKVKGLGVARSRFSYGGKAAQRHKLEQHVLELVARGIVVRLAEIAREKHDGWKVVRA